MIKDKIIKNLAYSQCSIPKLAKYDRINRGLKKVNIKKIKSVLDLGCGVGQTLYALKDCNFSGSYMGVDNDPKMIKMANNFFANRKYKNYKFKKCNIQNFQSKKKFDLIIIWGAISFFENYRIFLDKIIKLLNKGGTISLFSGFTENKFSVYVQYKYINGKKQKGLNMHSLIEILDYLKKQKTKVTKKKFIPNVNLEKTKNPLKSYILFDNKKNKILVNGLNIVRNFYFIEAKKI